MHPLNGLLRFAMELASLVVYALWGYRQDAAIPDVILAILLPLGFAVLWGIFAVRNDPSRSGKTVVQTPGILRLVLELGLFSFAVWMLADLDKGTLALALGAATLFHYLLSHRRILWLLRQS